MSWANGKSGQGVYFDGTDYIIDSYVNDFKIETGDFSICFWTKMNSGSCCGKFIDKNGGATSKEGYRIWRNNSKIYFSVGQGSSPYWVYGNNGTDLSLDTWHHACLSLDRDGDQKFFVDGQEVFSQTVSNSVDIDTTATTYSGNSNFRGYIDDIRVYRYAIPAATAGLLYNTTR